jgi:hypothetical protein
MINLYRINFPNKPKGKAKSFWEDIDEDLKTLRQKSKAHGIAYNQLIFNRDQLLWDGSKTVNDVPEADQQPPSEDEVNEKVQSMTSLPTQRVALQPPA